MKELMVHVERIVRPVAATQRRKLHMRRDLLGHMEAAFQEERANGAVETDAIEAAKKRLGDAAELTGALQRSVPRIQRLLLARVPLPRWSERWERHMGRKLGMGGMSLGQASLVTLGSMVLAYGTMVLLSLEIVHKYRDQLMRALSEQPWQYRIGALIEAILLMVIMGACFSIVGIMSGSKATKGQVAARAVWLIGAMVAWTVSVVVMSAGESLGMMELFLSVIAGVFLASTTSFLGRLTRRVGKPYEDWMSLNTAE